MKKFLIVLSLAGFGGVMAAPTVSLATGSAIVVKKGDDKEKNKKSAKKSCCSHDAKGKSCSTAEKKASGDKSEKAEKAI